MVVKWQGKRERGCGIGMLVKEIQRKGLFALVFIQKHENGLGEKVKEGEDIRAEKTAYWMNTVPTATGERERERERIVVC